MKLVNLRKSAGFGFIVGSLISVSATLAFTLWEWLENPSGIFHGPGGTNWYFVLETAISWLLPAFVLASLTVFISHTLVSGILQFAANRRRRAQKQSSDD